MSNITEKKKNYVNQFISYTEQYNKVIVVGVKNVGSKQMADVRIALRGKAVLVMGKNTMMRKAISLLKDQNPKIQALKPYVKGTIGLLFTNADLHEIRKVIESHRVAAPAKQGQISPVTVVIPAHNTGLEPTKTSFFQALNIPTKITKSTVEILSDVVLLKPGDKVGNSEATLLQLLNIKPFSYGLTIEKIYDNGAIYGPEVLDITDDDMRKRFMDALTNITSISLATGYPTEPAIPHMIIDGFKDLLAVAVSTDYTFKEAEATKEFIKDPSKFVVAPAKQEEKKEEKKEEAKEEKKEEKKEEEEEEADMGLDLFGDD